MTPSRKASLLETVSRWKVALALVGGFLINQGIQIVTPMQRMDGFTQDLRAAVRTLSAADTATNARIDTLSQVVQELAVDHDQIGQLVRGLAALRCLDGRTPPEYLRLARIDCDNLLNATRRR